MALSHADMQALARGLAPAVADHVASALAPLVARLAAVEARMAEAEKGGLRYEGVYQRAAEYRRGSVCTFDGCAWVALKDSPQGRPGSSDDWQLMVKSGRDGKDAK